MDVMTGGSFRERIRCEACIQAFTHPGNREATGTFPAPQSRPRTSGPAPGRLRGVRQWGSQVSSHSPESQWPTWERCSDGPAVGSGAKNRHSARGPRASRLTRTVRVVLRPHGAMLGDPAGLGACHLKQQSPGGKVQRWSLGPQAGGQEEKEPLKQTSNKCSCSNCSRQPRAGLACWGHDAFCGKILQLQYKWE